MTISAKLTSKGQITLPAELRKALGLKPGDRIEFVKTGKDRYELLARTKRFEDLEGIIESDVTIDLDKLDELIGEAVREKFAGAFAEDEQPELHREPTKKK